MSHFAKLNLNNIVTFVTVGRQEDDGRELELCERTGDVYRQTSYNTRGGIHLLGGTPFRYNYAGVGYTFDPDFGQDGAFIPPRPYKSWVLNPDTALWEPPVPIPEGGPWKWDEANQSWIEFFEGEGGE